MNFWQEPEWTKLKQSCVMKTERLLTRLEYLKEVGANNYSEEKYMNYIKTIKKNENEKIDRARN
ncbi:MAG: hypothetical protein IPJ03_15955 [Ignavibacteriales bacterium]|nr:hypothetical protein [Ignavibacteriales bacterium]